MNFDYSQNYSTRVLNKNIIWKYHDAVLAVNENTK